ncbi:hypothetical protein S245_021581, partial [Arachis hypogaea]
MLMTISKRRTWVDRGTAGFVVRNHAAEMEPTGRLPMSSENSSPAMTGLGPSREDGFEEDTKETGSMPGKDVVGFWDGILENDEDALEDGMTLVVARLDESSGENRAAVDIRTGQQGDEGSGKTRASVDIGTGQQGIIS